MFRISDNNISITRDSRGFDLCDGDYVLCVGKDVEQVKLMKMCYSFGILSVCNFRGERDYIKDSLVFKVTDIYNKVSESYLNSLKQMVKKFPIRSYALNPENFWYVLRTKEDIWKKENNKDTVVGIATYDYFGRSLKAGDLVLYADVDYNTYKYGIVISNKHIFTEDSKQKKVRGVFLVEDTLTQEELKIKSQINLSYKEAVKMSSKAAHSEYAIGDVYASSSIMYVYLGRVNLQSCTIKPSDVMCNYGLRESKVWLKINISGKSPYHLYDILESKNCIDIFTYMFNNTVVTVKKGTLVSSELYLYYRDVIGFNCLGTKNKNVKKLVGHINLSREYIIKFGHILNVNKEDTHVLHLELLDN